MIIRGLDAIKAHCRRIHQDNVNEWCERKGLSPYMAREVKRGYWSRYDGTETGLGWGANIVSERDEDYVIDALWDIPNR